MSNKTILFADDSVTMRTIMEKTFFAEPFDVVTVPSGEAAIAKVKEIEPDVVIVDAGMVGISGYDVCKAVRDVPHLSSTPLVILSGVSKQYDEALGESVGVDEHIKKPFDTAQVIEKVAALADRPRATQTSEPEDVLELVAEEEPDDFTSLDAPLDLTDDGVLAPEAEAEVVLDADDDSDDAAVVLSEEDEVVVKAVPKETQTYPRPSQPLDLPRPTPLQVSSEVSIGGSDAAIGEEQPITLQEPEPAVELEPEVEPIELGETGEKANSGSFQVGTLAELAQMDNKGAPLELEDRADAIEINPPSTMTEPVLGGPELDEPGLSEPALDEPMLDAPLMPAPSIETKIQEKAGIAASQVAASVEGVTAEQAQAIKTLTRDVIENIVWEVVPDLAETIIKEEIAKLLKE